MQESDQVMYSTADFCTTVKNLGTAVRQSALNLISHITGIVTEEGTEDVPVPVWAVVAGVNSLLPAKIPDFDHSFRIAWVLREEASKSTEGQLDPRGQQLFNLLTEFPEEDENKDWDKRYLEWVWGFRGQPDDLEGGQGPSGRGWRPPLPERLPIADAPLLLGTQVRAREMVFLNGRCNYLKHAFEVKDPEDQEKGRRFLRGEIQRGKEYTKEEWRQTFEDQGEFDRHPSHEQRSRVLQRARDLNLAQRDTHVALHEDLRTLLDPFLPPDHSFSERGEAITWWAERKQEEGEKAEKSSEEYEEPPVGMELVNRQQIEESMVKELDQQWSRVFDPKQLATVGYGPNV